MKFKIFFGLVLLVAVLLFVQQNSGPIVVRFFDWQQQVPLALLLLSLLLVGVVLGLMIPYARKKRKKRLEKKAQKEQQKKKAEAAHPAAEAPEQTVMVPTEADVASSSLEPAAEQEETDAAKAHS